VTTPARFAPVLSAEVVHDRALSFAREATRDHPVLLVRAHPQWAGQEVVEVDDVSVRILATSSPLRVLDALGTRAESQYLLVLTDRSRHELGDAIVLRTRRREVETLDEWNRVPSLFGAHTVDGRVRSVTGPWFPRALMQWQPTTGWPRVPAGVLTAPTAVGSLLARIIGHDPAEALDTAVLLERLDSPGVKDAWRALDDDVRTGLTTAVETVISPSAALALCIAVTCGPVSVVAIGLALDVLWPKSSSHAPSPEQIAARTRIERLTGVHPDFNAVRGLAEASIALTMRWEELTDTGVPHTLTQAQALLADFGWAAGADVSIVLPAGMRARVRAIAERAAAAVTGGTPAEGASTEAALGTLSEHLLSVRYRGDQLAAQMAVRLARWMLSAPAAGPETFADAIAVYRADGAWVDRAVSVLWDGSADAETSAAFATIVQRVRERRAMSERSGAALITGEPIDRHDVIGVERVMDRVVRPIIAAQPALMIVLDGMSAAVASELDAEIVREGWGELVLASATARLSAVATIPSVTRLSRASLFSGALTTGGQDVEKAAVAALGGVLFHKDDLRSGAGKSLPDAVSAAIADSSRRLVAVVLNTIDDALAKHDPGGTRWALATVQHLRPLLAAAAAAGRVVVFTSDHGHVIERGGEPRPIANAAQRSRPVDSGPPTGGELLVSGPRVLVAGNAVVVAQREDLRYAAKAAGYHGGVSLAELTVPIAVYRQPQTAAPASWADAAPAAPRWWNEPLTASAAAPVTATPGGSGAPRRPSRATPTAPTDGLLDFEVDDATEMPTASGAGLGVRLIASEVYASQKTRAGRAALDDAIVVTLVTALEGGGGRAHRDTLAATAGVATVRFDSTIVALRRVLNVDAYDVVYTDPDGVTIHLDSALLTQQFALGGRA
jgi:hypothetical protein